MTLVVGTRMVRVEDGMRGVVEVQQDWDGKASAAIFYYDRGELMRAKKNEIWEPEMTPPKKLTDEEIERVARMADAQLRSLERHEPFSWWKANPCWLEPTHDPGLVEVITEYLKRRA